jgi:hypothetical protein
VSVPKGLGHGSNPASDRVFALSKYNEVVIEEADMSAIISSGPRLRLIEKDPGSEGIFLTLPLARRGCCAKEKHYCLEMRAMTGRNWPG